ncbi:MAG: PDZ domain-containing protein [Planctomycetes bacterium]|nr:PDZ domain-containing protein [Planctomycetota bacterium]
MILAIAACSGNSDDPPPQASGNEVVIIATDAPPEHPVEYPQEESTEDERVVQYAKDEVNEDASDQPNRDLAENPNDDPSSNESPHPNKSSSAVGLGGGVGGGGTSGGKGGYVYRRARGGGGRAGSDAEPADPSTPGLKWAQTDAPTAELEARRGTETLGVFPLKHTDVKARVSGTLAGTTVTQTFTNPYTEVIEAVYTFPLPGDSAINDFVMQVGERRIVGLVRPREEAVKAYNEAKARGKTATLMTQNRANVFTQNVANIEVGGTVKICITYYQTLKYENGRFEYVFPLTLGPRYQSGSTKHEVAPDADRDGTDDPEEFEVHALPPGMRSGMDLDMQVEIDAGLPIDVTRLQCVTHECGVQMTNAGSAIIQLTKADAVPNRDFVLRWGIAGKAPSVGLLTHGDERGNFLNLQIQPQLDPADTDVTPREMTFILDVSGSMSGVPSQMSRDVIRKVLDHMKPDDIFNIVYFAGSNGQLFDAPRANTPENIQAAKDFLALSSAGGGTEMLAGLQRALTAEHDLRHLQIYTFLTDGYISGENEIFKTIDEQGQDARFFGFGIGSSVNRLLIDGIAEHGKGKAIYCLPRDGEYAEGAVEEFYSAIDMPVLCDIEIDWNEIVVDSVYPSKLNDLFAAQPLSLQATYSGSGKKTIYVNGRVGARRVSIPVELNLEKPGNNPAIAAIWARSRIADLSNRLLSSEGDRNLVDDITKTALEYNLISKYTSFIAIDESRVVGDGSPVKVLQPVEMPEGVTFAGDNRPAASSRSLEIESWGLVVGETDNGKVLVLKVKDGGPAAEAGMRPGQIIESINGANISNLDRLEELLLQSVAKVELNTSLSDGGETFEAKFKLPELKLEKAKK